MSKSTFNPGFRISTFDTAILCGALVGSVLLYRQIWWAGCAVAFVVLHYFLFCNVFRIGRGSSNPRPWRGLSCPPVPI